MMSDRGQLPDFWITSGVHLLEKNEAGALVFTPDFFRAYLERPELAPVENSCEVEIALYESLRENPFQRVDDVHISAMEDVDAQDNYRLILAFRDLLVSQGSLEAAVDLHWK